MRTPQDNSAAQTLGGDLTGLPGCPAAATGRVRAGIIAIRIPHRVP